jgi:hypothetical protein
VSDDLVEDVPVLEVPQSAEEPEKRESLPSVDDPEKFAEKEEEAKAEPSVQSVNSTADISHIFNLLS